MSTLKKIRTSEMRGSIPAIDLMCVSRSGEQVFTIANGTLHGQSEQDPLINVEIALRKGERVGFFTSGHGKQTNGK